MTSSPGTPTSQARSVSYGWPRRPPRSRTRRVLSDERGVAIVEAAIVSVLLVTMALGIVEFGNALSRVHTITALSREGANMASRGSSLNEAINVTMTNGSSIDLAGKGGVIATRILVTNGSPMIIDQAASNGYMGQSRMGIIGTPANSTDDWNLADGQSIYTVEIFYDYDQITPFGDVVNVVVPDQLYERAVF